MLVLAVFPVPAVSRYTPHVGDYFQYYEVTDLGSGTGNYAGYTEHTVVNGNETMNTVYGNGTIAAHYGYTWAWSNNTGGSLTGGSSGNFTYSSISFLYEHGTDNQTGYVNPRVWFYMDNTTQSGGAFYLLNTQMTVESTSHSYFLPSQNRSAAAIFAEGKSNYQRNDVYGMFTATYTWSTYFDPSTGYIIGYDYVEHDTNPFGDGFTYTETLYVVSTSYPLATAAASNPAAIVLQYLGVIALVIVVGIIVLIIVVAYALSRNRRRTLPQHPSQPVPWREPVAGPAPQEINLTPKQQPPVQQIVIKEIVKVKCRYCGALIDSTVQACPFCGAPRT